MGAYLSSPKVDKESTDEVNDYVIVGASSMQGWRNSQEDAHNSILNFDENTSFFAVYDGHGGAEVATYCADKLPEFLKKLESYEKGNLEQALKDAFLGFDKTLLEPHVVEVLKVLAGEKNFADNDDSDALDDDEDEDLVELHEESHLPLNDVLEKYNKNMPSMPALKKVKELAGGSKPQSPYLRGRRAAAVIADSVNKAVLDPDSKPQGSSTSAAAMAALAALNAAGSSNADPGPSSSKAALAKLDTEEPEEDSTVSSSSSSASKSNANANNNIKANPAEGTEAEAASSQKVTANGSVANAFISPDSSHVARKENEQNGSVTSSEAKSVKDDVSTSSATASKKQVADDATVSGSNEAAESKQNGNVGSSSACTGSSSGAADPGTISSTSKEAHKLKKEEAGEEDSTDDDADYDAENPSGDEIDPRHVLDFSSEDEPDMDDDEDDDDELDEDDDDDEDEGDEDEDEEMEEIVLDNERFCANMIEEPGKDSGCTAVVALLNGRDLYVANAGDSRCVVCRNGKAIEMSLDHKPEDDEESARIIKAGGRVTLDGRVNGGLNLSRAIGDHSYKLVTELQAEEQMISALPDIKKLIISPEDEFMVLACDGIWNYMSSEEVVDFVRMRLQNNSKRISQICEELFDHCLAPNTMGDGTGCDNMTAVIVRFQQKLLELPTKINPNETEDVLAAKKAVEADAADASLLQSLKRRSSPTPMENCNEAENAKKRIKTDEGISLTINTPHCNDAASSSTSMEVVAEQKECDSLTSASSDAHAFAAAAAAAGSS